MVSIYDGLDGAIEDLDEVEQREAYLNQLKASFPFLLCPPLFARRQDLPPLQWVRVKYNDYATHQFPNQQGVYIFVVSIDGGNLPINSYVMYVGKAGDITSNNTIAQRFRNYVNESGFISRVSIRKMIKHYKEHLYYYYATIPNGQSTSQVEQALADIFLPPCCHVDFSAEVRTLLRGARI
ncbi:hypothetical protein [Citrobacter portucalensis]|uniref:hypothetical protein n=1 Tax=Citrobacter portucalensis TaxID=1639133 RepID=UPI0018A59BC8|nr:hypothetical protein [Citrobacter portucalensis]BBV41342.1 hypothetical protein STW0522CIT26_28140 [Citrobacter portucalensis]BBV46323.1 hypothetical protein STW0522CIT27_27630 [Citrobacter portucalensis]BBV51605.1 hypothetical protein STW0522CIT30_28650 [Citrobacter portucalensis]BBW12337.1 hypothetical protein STN0717CIT27_28130 [Citrobacter portucalensis]BBW17389.1 hypothetical protein STN0717CIT36_28130 [Citrobacter portucalensis]